MPRIYKGNDTTLRLLIHTCTYEGTISDLKISLYTNDPSIAIEFTDRYTIDGNFVSLDIPNWAFGSMEDGVINYVAQGMIGDDTFLTNRQSNYYLKTPTNFTPIPMPEDVVLGGFTTTIVENGVFEYTPTDVNAWNKATIEVNVPDTNGSYDEGYNQGYEDGQNSVECPEGGTCNLGEGEILLDTTMAGTYELYASDDGYDGWSKFIVTLEGGGAIKVHKASDLLDTFNNGGTIDYGTYYYVGGKITEIQDISTQYGNATYTLDNGFSVYRGKWTNGETFTSEDQIKVGAYIVVYGVIAEYRGTLQFNAGSQVIAYQECEGGEIVSCNLEDKGVSPSMADRDDNGVIIIEESEGFDGLDRVVIDPSTIYNEGYNKALENVDKPLVELYATENGEYLPQRTITEVTPILDMDGDDVFSLNVGCGLIEETIEYTLRFRWKSWVTDDTISNIFGSEESDWDDSTFAIREYGGDFEVKIGGFRQMFRSDNEWHTLKMGATEYNETIYIEFDGERYETTGEETTFVRYPEPVYIGATNTGGEYFRNCKIDIQWIEYAGSNGKGRWTPIDGGFVVEYNGGVSENTDNLAGGYAAVHNEEVVTTEDVLGFSKVVVDVPQNGGGDCNIQPPKVVELDGEKMGIYPDEGYNGISEVIVEAGRKAEEWREEGRYDVKNKLQSIDITENGRYSADEQIFVNSLRYNGGYHTDTISTYDINRIEVTFKADTSESINSQGQPFILGGSMWGLNESGEDNECARAIQYAYGRIVGYWEGKWTDAEPTMDGEWLTIALDENGMTIKYPTGEDYVEYTHDNGNTNNGADILPFIIGGLGGRTVDESGNYIVNLIEDTQFRGLIKEVKVNTNSMGEITYIPNNLGYGVWDRLVENTGEHLSALEPTEGEVTMTSEWERKYGEGWKEINVNIVPAKDIYKETTYNWLMDNGQDFSDALSFYFLNKLRDDTTISDVAPGYPNSSYYKQGPLLICGSEDENQITEINNLVYDEYHSSQPQPDTINYCPVIYFGEMYCGNVQKISIDAFKHMDELYVVGRMVNLGESFKGEMIINFENCEHLFKTSDDYAAEDFIKSLYDFSKGPNKNGVTTSYIKLNDKFGQHDNFKNWVAERGWTLIESE